MKLPHKLFKDVVWELRGIKIIYGYPESMQHYIKPLCKQRNFLDRNCFKEVK